MAVLTQGGRDGLKRGTYQGDPEDAPGGVLGAPSPPDSRVEPSPAAVMLWRPDLWEVVGHEGRPSGLG